MGDAYPRALVLAWVGHRDLPVPWNANNLLQTVHLLFGNVRPLTGFEPASRSDFTAPL